MGDGPEDVHRHNALTSGEIPLTKGFIGGAGYLMDGMIILISRGQGGKNGGHTKHSSSKNNAVTVWV